LIKPTDQTCNYCGTIIETFKENKGWQVIQLPTGNELTIFDSGIMIVKFRDGRKAWVLDDGATSVDFHDGRMALIRTDGRTSVYFPDGRQVRIDVDGSTEVIETEKLWLPNWDGLIYGKPEEGRPII